MQALISRFSVPFEYPVAFTDDLLDPADPTLADLLCRLERRAHRVLVVVDQGVVEAAPDLLGRVRAYAAAHAEQMCLVGEPEVVPGGEAAKNEPALVTRLQSRLQVDGIDRHAFVMIIGGGAVLDMAGYAAATSHRGVRVVRVPTTVLSQCDGAVGVKTGVNAFATKNFLGTFTPPFAVAVDLSFIRTLSRRDRVAGLVEVAKVALIRDPALFEWMVGSANTLAAGDPAAMAHAIHRGAALHVEHIMGGGDPFELGAARPLDFGHWAAHRLEILSKHRLRHGEAVAMGIALDCRYACLAGLLADADLERIIDLFDALGVPLWDEVFESTDAVLRGLAEFREHLGGELTITMLRGIGDPVDVHEIDEARMVSAIDWLRHRRGAA